MSESVRKLTVKMPWSRQLQRAEVLEVHQRPGNWVGSDDPVLTFVTQEGRQTVRSVHPGRVVPLVAPGDPLTGGDPLYVLRREPVRARPRLAPRTNEGAPQKARRPFGAAWRARWERFGHWAWFVLAVGAYALAARLLIPQLQIVLGSEGPSAWTWILAASIGAGITLFGLLATRSALWPRRMTWGLAACWAALSVVALSDLTERMDLPIALRSIEPSSVAENRPEQTPEAVASLSPQDQPVFLPTPASEPSQAAEPEPEAPGPEQTAALVPVPQPRREPRPQVDEALLSEAIIPARSILPDLTDSAVVIRSGVRVGAQPRAFNGPQEAPVKLASLSLGPADRLPRLDLVPPPGRGVARQALPQAPAPVAPDAAAPIGALGLSPPLDVLALPVRLAGFDPAERDVDAPLVEPLPWLPPRFARVSLLFQYLEDPRDIEPPKLGADYAPDLPAEVALAVASSKVVEMRGMVQVTGWCIAAGDDNGLKRIQTDPEDYRRVALSDRLRLLLVEVEIESDTIGMLSDVLPVFGGADVGFFHNRRPMMGGWSGPQLLERGQAWMSGQKNDLIDPNYPSNIEGGAYFFSTEAALAMLEEQGCTDPIWQGGAPVTALGRAVAQGMQR